MLSGRLCVGRFIALDDDDAVLVDQSRALRHHVIDEVGSAVAVPCDIGLDVRCRGVADSRFVIPEAGSDIAGDGKAGMRNPCRAQPCFRLRDSRERQRILTDIIGMDELIDT